MQANNSITITNDPLNQTMQMSVVGFNNLEVVAALGHFYFKNIMFQQYQPQSIKESKIPSTNSRVTKRPKQNGRRSAS